MILSSAFKRMISSGFIISSTARSPYLILARLAALLLISAPVNLPSSQFMLTSKFPSAHSPRTIPDGHTLGRAGRSLISPEWLCKSISVTAAVYPRLASIWKTLPSPLNRLGCVPLSNPSIFDIGYRSFAFAQTGKQSCIPCTHPSAAAPS